VIGIETITRKNGTKVAIALCPHCGGRPASTARLFRRPNPDRFCECPFTRTVEHLGAETAP